MSKSRPAALYTRSYTCWQTYGVESILDPCLCRLYMPGDKAAY